MISQEFGKPKKVAVSEGTVHSCKPPIKSKLRTVIKPVLFKDACRPYGSPIGFKMSCCEQNLFIESVPFKETCQIESLVLMAAAIAYPLIEITPRYRSEGRR